LSGKLIFVNFNIFPLNHDIYPVKNKTVVITGGNDGIGFQTALALARMGANILIVSRNEQKAKNAVEGIKTSTGNSNINYVIADLSSQKSIRKAAEEIRKRVEKIDVLINNAGGTFQNFQLTDDGLERTIATNHFAYFLFTGLLLHLVKKSDYARIVNVSSGSHYRGKIDIESFTKKKGYFVMKAYGQSKLANVLFTFELAERLQSTNVTVNCLHPGVVKTRIGEKSGALGAIFWNPFVALFGISVAQGAKTSVYLASSSEVKGVTGKYFDNCKPKKPNPLAYDIALRKKLWEVSETLSGFSYSF